MHITHWPCGNYDDVREGDTCVGDKETGNGCDFVAMLAPKVPAAYWARYKQAWMVDEDPPRVGEGGCYYDEVKRGQQQALLVWIPRQFVLPPAIEGLGEVSP